MLSWAPRVLLALLLPTFLAQGQGKGTVTCLATCRVGWGTFDSPRG